jgi:hypothetical protein
LLLLHSEKDEIFSFKHHAMRLFAAARAPKRLIRLRGKHADAFFVSETVCRESIAEFAASKELIPLHSLSLEEND